MCVGGGGGGTIGSSSSLHLISCRQKMSGSSRLMYSNPPFWKGGDEAEEGAESLFFPPSTLHGARSISSMLTIPSARL